MASEGEGKEESRTGFAGLSSMVSNVDADVAHAQRAQAQQTQTSPADGSSAASAESSQASIQQQPSMEPYQQPTTSTKPDGGSGGKWLLGIGVVIGAVWLFSSKPGPNTSSTPPSIATAPTGSTSPQADDSAYSPSPDRSSEEFPPAGTNNLLGSAQIRYCLSEDIRLGAAKQAVNTYIEADVYRYNAMAAIYNSKCRQFRYRRGSLETVRSEVEANRAVLEAQGLARFAISNYSSGDRERNAPPPPSLPNARAQKPVSIIASSRPPKTPPPNPSRGPTLESNASRTATQPTRFASFMTSVRSGTAEDVEAMVRNGADVNMRIRGTTPIIEAVRGSNIGAATVLLGAGADPNRVDRDNHTALEYAQVYGDTTMANLLKAHGAVGFK